jgi:hypothetical protein
MMRNLTPSEDWFAYELNGWLSTKKKSSISNKTSLKLEGNHET